MSRKMPPVPPAGRSDQPVDGREPAKEVRPLRQGDPPEPSGKTGRHADIAQNTRHQGYQQDR